MLGLVVIACLMVIHVAGLMKMMKMTEAFAQIFGAHMIELLVRKNLITKEDGIELLKSVSEYMELHDLR